MSVATLVVRMIFNREMCEVKAGVDGMQWQYRLLIWAKLVFVERGFLVA